MFIFCYFVFKAHRSNQKDEIKQRETQSYNPCFLCAWWRNRRSHRILSIHSNKRIQRFKCWLGFGWRQFIYFSLLNKYFFGKITFFIGQASSNEEFSVYYGERLSWCKIEQFYFLFFEEIKLKTNFFPGLDLKVTGNTGHGSRFIEKTAAEKLVSYYYYYYET